MNRRDLIRYLASMNCKLMVTQKDDVRHRLTVAQTLLLLESG